MLKKAAAMFLVCAGMAIMVSCTNSRSNRYLYAALPTPNNIVVYREDPNSGVLSTLSISPITAGQGVRSLVIHPSNKFMYAVNSFENDVSLYTLSDSGALTEMGTRQPTGTSPQLAVMDSAGQFLYVINSGSDNISSFSIDASSGTLTPVVGSPFPIGAQAINMRVSPSGNFLYVSVGVGIGGSGGSIEIWNLSSGALSQNIDVVQAGTTPSGMAIDSSGSQLYVSNFGDNSISIYPINANGDLGTPNTIGAGLGVLSSPVALLIDNSGKFLYVANESSSTVVAYSIASDGSLALLPSSYSIGANSQPSSLATDASGNYLFVTNIASPAIQSFSRDTASGVLTFVQSYSLAGNAATSMALSP
jgi:6-phosphogluconolactonase (cycloisomerase 2 family)